MRNAHFKRSQRPHQPEKVKNLAVAMYSVGSSMEAISRVLEVKGETVYSWLKKALWAWELLRILAKQKGRRAPGQRLAKLISFDKMWTYLGARRGDKRRECWIWTAVVEEWDGRRWRTSRWETAAKPPS